MRKKSTPVTPEIVELVKRLLASNQYHQHEIAAMVGFNQGRVSEIKKGVYG